jgi:hypothetical protein
MLARAKSPSMDIKSVRSERLACKTVDTTALPE